MEYISKELNYLWHPDTPGPGDRCLRCFKPDDNDEFSFCLNCGHKFPHFSAAYEHPKDKYCFYHKDSLAWVNCDRCEKPICEHCSSDDIDTDKIEEQFKHSIDQIISPVYYTCIHCIKKIEEIENTFFQRLKDNSSCAKHENRKNKSNCIVCGLPVCELCMYFTLDKGILKKRITGPYCLLCFRWNHDGLPWLSFEKAIKLGYNEI